MSRPFFHTAFITSLAGLALSSCEQQRQPDDQTSTANVDTPTPQGSATPAQASPSPSAAATDNDGYPAMTPPVLTPEAERGVKGATGVLLSWARAIELREFDQAWAMLSESDRRKWSKTEWARQFADLGNTTVAFEPGTMEGAAGSSYYTAPITITANDRDGRPVRYAGEATLRRVNDVPGATPAQLRWHFERLTLDWTH